MRLFSALAVALGSTVALSTPGSALPPGPDADTNAAEMAFELGSAQGRSDRVGASHASLPPERVFDSRGLGGVVPAGDTITVAIADIPERVSAVVANITIANATGDGFFTVWDCAGPAPGTSNGNFVGIDTVAANVVTGVGPDGALCVELGQASAHVIVDVVGYFEDDGGFEGRRPTRVLDTRQSNDPGSAGAAMALVPPGTRVNARVADVSGDAVAAVLNVTAANATGDGFFTVWDCVGPAPGTSNGNFVGIGTIANTVITALGPDGEICLQTGQSAAHLIVDVFGFLTMTSGFSAGSPLRAFDTRQRDARRVEPSVTPEFGEGRGPAQPGQTRDISTTGATGAHATALRPGQTTTIVLDGIPAGSAAVLNVTAANATDDGYFAVWNCLFGAPTTSNGNFVGVDTIANSVIVPVGGDGEICVRTGQSSAEIIVDVFGHLPTSVGGIIAADLTDPSLPPPSREQLVVDVAVEPPRARAGDTVELQLGVTAPGGFPDRDVSVRLELADGLSLVESLSAPAQCSGASTVVCRIGSDDVASALSGPITLPVMVSGDASGLHGVSAIAWFDDDEPPVRPWSMARDGTEAAAAMVLVADVDMSTASLRSGDPDHTSADLTRDDVESDSTIDEVATRDVVTRDVVTRDVVTRDVADRTATGDARAAAERATELATEPSAAFCELFDAISAGGTVQAAAFTFSDLSGSISGSGSCSASSTITLSAADVDIAGVTFTDVSGTATPSSITLVIDVSDPGGGLRDVDLTITGPFPDAGSEFSASLSFDVGSTGVAIDGSVDYSTADTFTVTFNATADGFDWRPISGLSVADAGISGTFNRATTGGATDDTFDIRIDFSGSWKPIAAIDVTGIGAQIANTSGDLDLTVTADIDAKIDVAGLSIDLDDSLVGVVDLTTEVITLTVDIDPVTIAGLVSIGETEIVLTHDPRAAHPAPADSSKVSGSTQFGGALEQFFSGAVAGSLHLFDEGYVAAAEIDQGTPATPGYSFDALHLAYAGLADPSAVLDYVAPTTSGGTSTPGVSVPLPHATPFAVAPLGVPENLASAMQDLGIEIFNDVGSGVASIALPPADPSLSIYYAPPGSPYLFGNASSDTSMRFDDIFASVGLGETESFTIGGAVTLDIASTELDLTSAVSVTVLPDGVNLGGSLTLTDAEGWKDAFGIEGLTVFDLSIGVGIADELPSFSFGATASFPPAVTEPIGLVDGAEITIGIALSIDAPCFVFEIEPPPGETQAIDIGDGVLTGQDAQFIMAPLGCTIGDVSYSGFSLAFQGAIEGVSVDMATSFTLAPSFALSGTGEIGAFPIAPGFEMNTTLLEISLSADSFSFWFSGGFDVGGSLTSTGVLHVDSAGGFDFLGQGTLDIGGERANISVEFSDCADATCSTLTTPTVMASGDIDIEGFRFAASIEVSADGTFDAKLEIPKQTHRFSFDEHSVQGSGELTYSLSVEVSDTGHGGMSASLSVGLSSCRVAIFSCGRPGLSVSGDLSPGRIDAKIEVRTVVHFTISMTV